MKALTILQVSLRSLRRTPLRSALTALGIIIGVAAVVAMVSIGNGARARVEKMLAGMDATRLSVSATMPRSAWRPGEIPKVPPGGGLNIADYRAIRAEVQGVEAATPLVSASSGRAAANGRATEARVLGMDVEGFELAAVELTTGVIFGRSDVAGAASVCLISEFLAELLFSSQDAVGKTVRIKDVPFLIIGVIAVREESDTDPSRPKFEDRRVLIPYTSLLRRLDRNAELSIWLKVRRPEEVGRVQEEVRNLLERRRGPRTVEFNVGTAKESLEAYTEGSRTMALLLAAIAGISLLVGGIGIMNIMLVNVTERTREIGIRLAVGARGSDVLKQFLVEAVALSLFGGAIGILLGVGAAGLFSRMNGWPTLVTTGTVLLAFLCSAGVGIFFGYYPARRAAQLDPIVALRSE